MKIIKFFRDFFKKPSLLKELFFAFTLVCVAVTAIGYVIYYNSMFNLLQNRQEKETIQQFQQLDININTFLDTINNVSEILLNNLSNQDRNYTYQDEISQLLNLKDYTDENAIRLLNNINSKLEQTISNYTQIQSVIIYTGKGDIIGCTDTFTRAMLNNGKGEYVYKSKIYDRALEHYPRLLWFGGNSHDEMTGFSNFELDFSRADTISAVRSFKSLFTGDVNGVLVININQQELTDSYKYLFDSEKENAYIVDEAGKIISSADRSSLGKESSVFKKLKSEQSGSSSGSFVWNNGNIDENVFFYKIHSTGWTLVNEVPYSQYRKDIILLQRNTILVFLLVLISILLISYILFKRITRPLDTLTEAMSKLGKGSFGMSVENTYHNEFGLLAEGFNQMSENISQLIDEKENIAKEKRKHEIATLQAQINPHFIFNTINTIKWMAVLANANNIVESLVVFSNLLKPLFKIRYDYYTIEEEMEYLCNYVRLLNYRYGDVIVLHSDIPQEIGDCTIPRFVLQPLVENAVEHGMDFRNNKFPIYITASYAEGNIRISIKNQGAGIGTTKLEEIRKGLNAAESTEEIPSHIGLKNINQRLRLYYGKAYGISIDSEEGVSTTVFIVIPKQKKNPPQIS